MAWQERLPTSIRQPPPPRRRAPLQRQCAPPPQAPPRPQYAPPQVVARSRRALLQQGQPPHLPDVSSRPPRPPFLSPQEYTPSSSQPPLTTQDLQKQAPSVMQAQMERPQTSSLHAPHKQAPSLTQQAQQQEQAPPPPPVEIHEVWSGNLEDEFSLIGKIVEDYPYVAMDTEFPGTIFHPENPSIFPTRFDYYYGGVKANIDATQLIQVGLTFFNADGDLPAIGTKGAPVIWQFNFREFNWDVHIQAEKSIDLLHDTGIDFLGFMENGVDVRDFGYFLMSSGAVLNDDVAWIGFEAKADFGYLIKLLTGREELPETRAEFLKLVKMYFPNIYDAKYMAAGGGLKNTAEQLGIRRVGNEHLAGSDSLLTAGVFLAMKELKFAGEVERFAGIINLINGTPPATSRGS